MRPAMFGHEQPQQHNRSREELEKEAHAYDSFPNKYAKRPGGNVFDLLPGRKVETI